MFRGAMMLCGFAGGSMLAFQQSPSSAVCDASSSVHCKQPAESIFNKSEFTPFRLISSQYETHDTRRFHFSTGNAETSAALPIASCIVCKFTDSEGKDIIRPYTPISTADRKGSFELLIKRYPQSKMGTHMFQMKVGEELLMKGPFEKFKYSANQWKHIAMVAGGTGITPMYQVIRGVLDNGKDKTHLSLVYANNSRKDILLNNELSELCRIHNNFDVYFTLLDVPKRWLGGVGYITKDVLQTFLPKPGEKNTKILVCGPPPMMKAISGDKDYSGSGAPQQGALTGFLAEMGYSADQVFKF